MSEQVSPLKYFICGGFGGICTVLTGHPMDTLKVRLQTMPLPKPGEKPLYSGFLDCFIKTIKHEGIYGLYKGMGAPLIGIAPIFAISFFSYGLGLRLFQSDANLSLSPLQVFTAGAFSGIFTTSIMTPGERIKCLLQIQHNGGPQKYKGMTDCVKQLYREGGIRSFYKGNVACLYRDVPGSGVYFLTYEWIKDKLTDENTSKNKEVLITIVAGGLAGIALWGIALPADVIKSRLQSAPEGTYPNGMRDVLTQLLKHEGPLALYKGITPIMIRAFPANAACFAGFEFANNCVAVLEEKYNISL